MPSVDLTGTWVFNDYISPPNGDDVTFNFSFISDYESFTAIRVVSEDGSLYYMEYISEDTSLAPARVYDGSWNSESGRHFQTIKILSKLSEVTNGSELLTWLQANATKQESATKVSVDLTTLQGWSSLSGGTHNITIVAKADGYRDSAPSAAVQVEKAPAVVMPNKGDIITLDSKQYRVLN